MPSQNDMRWQKGQNTGWQDPVNQRFINQHALGSSLLDQGGIVSDSEENNVHSPEEIHVADASSDEDGAQTFGDENEAEVSDNPEDGNFDASRVVGQKHAPLHLMSRSQPTSSRPQGGQTENTHHGCVGQEDDTIIERFLGTMEEDQDLCLHLSDSIARLRRFLQNATLDNLEGDAGQLGDSRILLEDRNFSRKTFRQYPRTLTPKQLYDALRKQVSKSIHVYLLG